MHRVLAAGQTERGSRPVWCVAGGVNEGSAFLRYGSVDVALGWPLPYSHSPGEVIDIKDLDALRRIAAVIERPSQISKESRSGCRSETTPLSRATQRSGRLLILSR